jgi:tetratricopeptide (TPR) repeat protein
MSGRSTGAPPADARVAELARLEEERDDLLAAMGELDHEHGQGRLDDDEYEALRDDYTSRVAAVVRCIQAGRTELPRRRTLSARVVLTVLSVAAVVMVVAGVVLADSSGSRLDGNITGDVDRTNREQVVEASVALMGGSYDEALELADGVLAEDPDDVGALVVRGEALLRQDDPLEALTTLDRALELDPDHPRATMLRGVVLVRLPDPEFQQQGLGLLDRAVELAPQDWMSWIERGAAYEQLTDDDSTALDSYRRALALQPPSPIDAIVQESIDRLDG